MSGTRHGRGGPSPAPRESADDPGRPPPDRTFTRAELARHDGSVPGRPILIAHEGYVYDVSESFMWMHGRHFWLLAGRDLTGRLGESPHGREMLGRAACVGRLID